MSKDTIKIDHSYGIVPISLDEKNEPRFLLVQHHAGHWGFPKGHPEKGESPMESAIRECDEETGVKLSFVLESPFFEERYSFEKRSGQRVEKVVTYFLAVVSSEKAKRQEKEIADLAWGNADKTHKRLTFHAGEHLLEEVLDYLGDAPAKRLRRA